MTTIKRHRSWDPLFLVAATLIILFLLFYTNKSKGQGNIPFWYKLILTNGAPVSKPNSTTPALQYMATDTTNNLTYRWIGSQNKWVQISNIYKGEKGNTGAQGPAGNDGASATVAVGNVSTTTLAPGNSAQVTVTDADPNPSNGVFNFSFLIPRGADGSGGTSFAYLPYVTPYVYGATGDGKTFAQLGKNQAYVDANYPGMGATVNDAADWAAMQKCINSYKPIVVDINLFPNKDYILPKNYSKIDWDGQYYKITLGAGCVYGFQRIPSTTLAITTEGPPKKLRFTNDPVVPAHDAESLAEAAATIDLANLEGSVRNFIIQGNTNQTGFRLGGGNRIVYDHIQCLNLKWAIYCEWEMESIIQNCDVGGCLNGYFVSWYEGFSWATPSNSQCVGFRVLNSHCYGANPTDKFIYTTAQGFVGDGIDIEGGPVNVGVDINSPTTPSSNTDKQWWVNHIYVEGTINTAAVRANMNGGSLNINGVIGVLSTGVLADIKGVNGTVVYVSDVAWWTGQTGKWLKSDGPVWYFRNCQAFNNEAGKDCQQPYCTSNCTANMAPYFLLPAGRTLKRWTSAGCCGGDTYHWECMPN